MTAGNMAKFLFEVEGLQSKLQVAELQGHEAISSLFSYSVTVVSEDHEIDFAKVISHPSFLTFVADDEEVARHVHGIVANFELIGLGTRLATYRVRVVPQAWLLTQRFDCRIFQSKSVIDIIKEVAKGGGIPGDRVKFVMQGSYAPRDYCVQYRESDFDFLSRLMEEEGIFYFFEHSDDGHVMVFSDQTGVHANITGKSKLAYHPPTTGVATEETIYPFIYREAAVSGAVVFDDFNFRKPALDLTSTKKYSVDTALEVYDYPGHYDATSGGDHLVKVRLESIQVARKVGDGESNCMRLIAGFKFQLEDHPREPFNQEYLITRVETSARQPQVYEESAGGQFPSYHNQFSCIPAAVQFRAPRATPKPYVRGVQTAIVVGPSGEEIYTDEHGRVKVQFHWDRLGKNDEKSSCWIRVAQIWAGASWGAMFLPRIGHEVIVDFEEGDPDRPIVTGRVYHGTNKPPYSLPAEKTKSTIKSNSSKGGGGFNEFRFEDKKGSEEIFLHGQKDWTIAILNDKNQDVGHDETLHVGNDRTKNVDKNQTETIGENKTISVGKNHSESIGENASIDVGKNEDVNIGVNQAVTVGTDLTLSVGKNRTESVGSNHSESIGKNADVTIGKNQSIQVGEKQTEQIGKDYELTVGGSEKISITKDLSVNVGKKTVISSGDEISLTCGSASIVMKKNGDITISGKNINIKGSGNITMKGTKITQN